MLQNYEIALKWYRRATEQGLTTAQFNLGFVYAKGQGVLEDNAYAHMWGNIDASNGYKDGGKIREVATKDIAPAQISEAQNLARECKKKNYKGC